MNLKELLQLSDDTILKGVNDLGERYLSKALEYHAKMFGASCYSCPSHYPQYVKQLRMHEMKTKEPVKQGNFKLKKGTLIPILGTSEAYSAVNITDEIALRILSKNKKAINLFEEAPNNWEEQVEAYKRGATLDSIDEIGMLKYDEIRILFPDAKGGSKKQLLADIAKKYPELKR